jgi:hypothetical protein
MIKLFTGLPGHGKTLRAIFELIQLERAERKRAAAGELDVFSHFYHLGVDGLDPSIAEPLPFPIQRWRELPRGSVVVVDEAWKYFPQRGPGSAPDWIGALAEHRHLGIEFWLVSQDPRQLDAFVRRLVERHVHLSRKAGLRGALVFSWDRLQDDPTNYFALKQAQKETWRYPRKLFKVYRSATVHLVKVRVPFRIWVYLALLPVVLFLLWRAFGVFRGDGLVGEHKSMSGVVAGSSSSAASGQSGFLSAGRVSSSSSSGSFSSVPAGGSQDALGRLPLNATPEQYAQFFIPRIPGMPWSAPWHDAERPTAKPDVYCIVASGVCRCYTEQITRLVVPVMQCMQIARDGVYNPFREPLGRERDRVFSSADRNGSGVGNSGLSSVVGRDPSLHEVGLGRDLKVNAGSGEEGERWPRPDFSYRVPFPDVGSSKH